MKFTALPVKSGDSFLLEDSSSGSNPVYYLVDTGSSKDECNELLRNKYFPRNHNKLDVVIITHYDGDHVNGLLSLITSDSININEIWLPHHFGIIKKASEDVTSMLYSIINNTTEQHGTASIFSVNITPSYPLEFWGCISGPRESKASDRVTPYSYNSIVSDKVSNIKIEIIASAEGESTIARSADSDVFAIAYINKSHIEKINSIVEQCNSKKVKIRWIRYTGKLEDKIISNKMNLYGVNCVKLDNNTINIHIDDFITLCSLSKINRESLVYKYHKDDETPNVLFSADSGFEFIKNKKEDEKITLNENSIVTAAHHGSADNKNVKTYGLVKGKNLIYVRSDSCNSKRPCKEYTELANKYCTVCNDDCKAEKKTAVAVCLKYNGKEWDTENVIKCSCKYVK